MRYCLLLIALFVPFLILTPLAHGDTPWEMTLFSGQLVDEDLVEIPFNSPDFKKRYLLGLSARKEIWQLKDKIPWIPEDFYLDGEGTLVHKWGNWKDNDQEFQEIAGSLNLRYEFAKNWIRLNSMSLGNGLSLATKKPQYEKDITLNGSTSQVLYHISVDIDFDIPHLKKWKPVLRLHHRSGMFGLINNVDGGSNYLCFGLRHPLDLF